MKREIRKIDLRQDEDQRYQEELEEKERPAPTGHTTKSCCRKTYCGLPPPVNVDF
jgi:hypothetical protein